MARSWPRSSSNDGTLYRAVRYVNADGRADYYTPDGKSLRKAFLKAPVQFSRISSIFNPRRRHPVLNRIRAHRGVDYAAPTGTPVRAAGAGRVQYRGVKGGFGNVVETASTLASVVTRYGHLSRFAKGVGPGTKVDQGEVIGYVGRRALPPARTCISNTIERGVYMDPQQVLRKAEPGPPMRSGATRWTSTLQITATAGDGWIRNRPAATAAARPRAERAAARLS